MIRVPVIGVPYDARSSGRPGARYGPSSVRTHMELLEEYSHVGGDYVFLDYVGDIENIPVEGFVDYVFRWLKDKGLGGFIAVGGDHSVTIPLVKFASSLYKDLFVVSVDAHLDLRDEYAGDRFSHACTLRRLWEIVQGRVFQVGGRSGDREEYRFAIGKGIMARSRHLPTAFEEALSKAGDRPVYLTIDLDIFDPAFFPGTGTPEPGGVSPFEFFEALSVVRMMNVVFVDLVELNPILDPSGASTLLACKVLREVSFCLKR